MQWWYNPCGDKARWNLILKMDQFDPFSARVGMAVTISESLVFDIAGVERPFRAHNLLEDHSEDELNLCNVLLYLLEDH